LSVQTYFTKFNTIFPVIHGQTFRPTPKNSLLLLSICSIGSLLVGIKGAATQGVRIFERLNKAILAMVCTITTRPCAFSAPNRSIVGKYGVGRPYRGNINDTGGPCRADVRIALRCTNPHHEHLLHLLTVALSGSQASCNCGSFSWHCGCCK
jgi:hypothetical protein